MSSDETAPSLKLTFPEDLNTSNEFKYKKSKKKYRSAKSYGWNPRGFNVIS
jgi:hypothetical protein